MNKERLLELADLLDEGGSLKRDGLVMRFNMASFGAPIWHDDKENVCKTNACIAGWAVLQFGGVEKYKECLAANPVETSAEIMQREAKEILGLDHAYATVLFMTRYSIDECGLVSNIKAARVIRELVDTGSINWYN